MPSNSSQIPNVPRTPDALQPHQRGLIFAREFGPSVIRETNLEQIGEPWNASATPQQVRVGLNEDMGTLDIWTDGSTGNPAPEPRGRTWLIPDWTDPALYQPIWPNVSEDDFNMFWGASLTFHLRTMGVNQGQLFAELPDIAANVPGIVVGPAGLVGNVTGLPFWTCELKPDDQPLPSPQLGSPGKVITGKWDDESNPPSTWFFSEGWGTHIYVRCLCLYNAKSDQTELDCWVSTDGFSWQYAGAEDFDGAPRRVGFHLRNDDCSGQLDWVRAHQIGPLPQFTSVAQIASAMFDRYQTPFWWNPQPGSRPYY